MDNLFALFFPTRAYAEVVTVGPCGTANGLDNRFQSLCENSISTPVGTVLGNILTIVLAIAAVLAVVFLIWGGIKWITSGGDKAAVDIARKTIIAAIIGLILTFLSFFILSVIFGLFGLNFASLSLPRLTTDTTTCSSAKEYYDSTSASCKKIDAVYCGNIGEGYNQTTGTCTGTTGPR